MAKNMMKQQKQAYGTFGVSEASTPSETYANASPLARLVFGYASPVLAIGQMRQLDMDDLWVLEGENRSSAAVATFKAAYERHQRSIIKAIIATSGRKILWSGLGSFLMAACAVFAPVVLHHVIDTFTAPAIDLGTLRRWMMAFLMSRLINAFLEAHINFTLEMAMLQLSVSMKAFLFEKAMRRSVQSKIDTSTSTANVNNLFTADIDNLMWAGYQINVLWIMPIQVSVVIYMLYKVLDVAAFVGLGVIVGCTLLNYIVAKGYIYAYNDIMKLKDTRMKIIKEVFSAIQIIKLNAWQTKFLTRIREWRAQETRAIAKYLYYMAMSTVLFWGSPLCVSVASFATYSLVLGKELTAAKVFTAMVLFTAIQDPLSAFPDALQTVVQAWLALGRISKYLETDEISLDRIRHESTMHDADVMIAIDDATFRWKDKNKQQKEEQSWKAPVLEKVSFKVHKGDFVVIHGPVGAGKSSLCAAMLGELPTDHGNVFVRSRRVAYYSQQPWIQNRSIRDNILFGQPYDKTKYDRVLDACGLVKDISMFPAGDATEIGQKGVNLSGGQKARVSLARACYSEADIYILDTPLAAVDAVVQSEIFNRCLCDLLEDKTIVLVTHLQEVIKSPAVNVSLLVEDTTVKVTYTPRTQPRRAYANLYTDDQVTKANETIDDDAVKSTIPSGTLVEEEEREDGRVSSDVFFAYTNALGGIKVLVWYMLILVGLQSFQAASDLWLSHWTGTPSGAATTSTTKENLTVYALLTLGAGFFLFVRTLVGAYTGLRASQYLFDEMTKSLLYAPLRFFDANPIGRILNRYAEDISNVDFRLHFKYFGMLVATSLNIFRLLMAIYIIRWGGLLLLPLGWIYARVGFYYLASSREISRLMKVSTSPVLSHLSESEEGVTVLRAFGQLYVDRAIQENLKRCDRINQVWYAQTVANQWFSVRVQLIGFTITVLIVSTLLALRHYMSPGLVGLALMYAINIDLGIAWWVKSWSWLEMAMVSTERIREYIEIPPEGNSTDRLVISSEWPQSGAITFENVHFAYKPGGDLVLQGVSFVIGHNEKIGIVGRTGAGKSSLTMAIFRINELTSGRILLDGVDISTVNVQTLRSHMSIIPQIPVLFQGSLRAYMDPFEEHEDVAIWQALDNTGMKATVSGLEGKLAHELSENGENFSVGERQLLCLARALLRQSRVVIMDEATASIDVQTEQRLQQMIQSEFGNATVLTIAHRLATVLTSDRILVLSDGHVVEFDTPRALVQRHNGVFRELARESGYLEQLL